MFKQLKKIWLLAVVFILIISLGFIVFRNYLLKKELAGQPVVGPETEKLAEPPVGSPELEEQLHFLAEQKIEGQVAQCIEDFDLNKLDFTQPIWDDTELSAMLPQLIAMEAFQQNNERGCDYFKNKGKINPDLTVENCLRRYRFLNTTVELKEGMNCQSYLEECKKFINLDVAEKDREETEKVVCESLCQSYQNKTPIILAPENICDDPQSSVATDAVNYFEAKTNQTKICLSGIADKIKFLIAVARNDSNDCLTINNPKTSPLCQSYFDKDYLRNKFKEAYCQNLIQKVVIPPE